MPYYVFSCSVFRQVQAGQGLNSRSLWFSFGWSTKRKFLEGPALRIGPLQKIQREKIYFPYIVRKNMKSCHKFSKNYSTHGKNCETSDPNNFSLLLA